MALGAWPDATIQILIVVALVMRLVNVIVVVMAAVIALIFGTVAIQPTLLSKYQPILVVGALEILFLILQI